MVYKIKMLFAITVFLSIFLLSCGIHDNNNEVTYKIVPPTEKEIDEITESLDPILSTYFDDYDYLSDNMYNNLFSYNRLKYIVPKYEEQIAEFIAEPLEYLYGELSRWDVVVYDKDPLGRFGEISDIVFDENGNIDIKLTYESLQDADIIGYKKFSGAFIDWLVENVWNGKTDHDTLYDFEDGSRCYYYDGFYYTPEQVTSLGGGIFHYPEITNVVPIKDNKYEIKYVVFDDVDRPVYYGTAIIALKESSEGFRFWSILSIIMS